MAKVLIAGCGYVGSVLAGRLMADGDEVWGMRRHVAALPAGVRPIEADLASEAPLPALPAELDAVVYALAADGFTEDAYRIAYVDGLRRLLDAMRKQGGRPRRLIYVSSTGVFAQQDGE